MAIKALPSSTTRLLGATSGIASPVSVVKELVENALDAGATSVDVMVSANGLDKIRVRDNGHGIPLDDLDALGRRGHTSKLLTFEQFREGVDTLGFRGDALAHINEIAKTSITTRSAGAPVATKVDLRHRSGGVENTQPVSAPLGSTIQATQLFENTPVRKQMLLRESARFVTDVKHLMSAYALARKSIRLSLKVFGEVNNRWSYSPSPSLTDREVLALLFGWQLAPQCLFASTVGSPQGLDRQVKDIPFTLQVALPAIDCKDEIVSNIGFFAFINDRPLAAGRGLGKKMLTIVKRNLKEVRPGLQSLVRPFIWISVRCASGKIDPNVAPLKDEVICSIESEILVGLERLCAESYQLTPKEPTAISNRQSAFSGQQSHASDTGSRGLRDGGDLPTHTAMSSNPGRTANESTPGYRGCTQMLPEYSMKTLRISSRVNMLRTASDGSDATISGSAAVAVNLIRGNTPIEEVTNLSSKKLSTLTPRAPGCLSQGILKYFNMQETSQVEVATDDTATVERPASYEVLEPVGGSRVPLQQLTESALNALESRIGVGSRTEVLDLLGSGSFVGSSDSDTENSGTENRPPLSASRPVFERDSSDTYGTRQRPVNTVQHRFGLHGTGAPPRILPPRGQPRGLEPNVDSLVCLPGSLSLAGKSTEPQFGQRLNLREHHDLGATDASPDVLSFLERNASAQEDRPPKLPPATREDEHEIENIIVNPKAALGDDLPFDHSPHSPSSAKKVRNARAVHVMEGTSRSQSPQRNKTKSIIQSTPSVHQPQQRYLQTPPSTSKTGDSSSLKFVSPGGLPSDMSIKSSTTRHRTPKRQADLADGSPPDTCVKKQRLQGAKRTLSQRLPLDGVVHEAEVHGLATTVQTPGNHLGKVLQRCKSNAGNMQQNSLLSRLHIKCELNIVDRRLRAIVRNWAQDLPPEISVEFDLLYCNLRKGAPAS